MCVVTREATFTPPLLVTGALVSPLIMAFLSIMLLSVCFEACASKVSSSLSASAGAEMSKASNGSRLKDSSGMMIRRSPLFKTERAGFISKSVRFFERVRLNSLISASS